MVDVAVMTVPSMKCRGQTWKHYHLANNNRYYDPANDVLDPNAFLARSVLFV